ncbi:MAG: helix-turn-helix domain-containing protein [Mycolicibacterium sp.]|nr:helix-turn-helix domain-containing protein [Mycolicibacterium sp.]
MTGRPRLAELGSDPGSVLTVLRYFDALADGGRGTEDILAAVAELAGCPVVVDAGIARLERRGPAHPLDELVADRLSRLLARRAAVPHLGDPALVEVVISGKEDRVDRGRAIRLLGFDESRNVRVLAVSADVRATLRLVLGALSGGRVATATLGRTVAVLYQGGPAARPLGDAIEAAIATAYPAPRTRPGDRGPWVGIGSETGIFAAPKSWSEALGALRFASSTGYGRHVIAYERLGVLELLARLPAERIAANRDIARINEIAATGAGALDVSTVEAFCVFGTLRRTAEELHVHHSTVAARLAHLSERMGWDFDDPMDRFTATLTLMVRRISLSAAALAADDLP